MRTILITGASGGLGQALCRAFSKEKIRIGLHVFQNQHKGKEIEQEIRSNHCETSLFPADLRNSNEVHTLFQAFLEKWERIDLVINNAGVAQNRLFQKMSSEEWDKEVHLNLSGVFYILREAGKIMEKQKKGHIINIASFAAFTGRVGQAPYTASKRGLIALAQCAAREFGAGGVQVNTVCPGFLPTPMTASLTPEQSKPLIAENVLGRASTLEEVSEFIQTLSKMNHVSGQIFHLDSRIT